MAKLRALLLYNLNAGYEDYPASSLLALLRARGFTVKAIDIHRDDYKAALRTPADVIVVAGGDGTVGKVARALGDQAVPLGIIPLGTANNIATHLGIAGTPEAMIKRWDTTRQQGFDKGIIVNKAKNKQAFFIESVGFGLFPKLIRARSHAVPKASREAELKDALRHQLDILSRYPAHRCRLTMDGEKLSGAYLAIEIMNIGFAGANMHLAPDAVPDDGLLDVVLVRATERDAFGQFLVDSLHGKPNKHPFPIHRAARVSIEWEGRYYHQDDKIRKSLAPTRLDISVLPKALSFLQS